MSTKNAIQIIDGNNHILFIHVPANMSEKDREEIRSNLKEHGVRAVVINENIAVSAVTTPPKTITLRQKVSIFDDMINPDYWKTMASTPFPR